MIKPVIYLIALINVAIGYQIFGTDEEYDLDAYEPHHPPQDNSTYGNVDEIRTTHYHVDWTIDFDNSKIVGSVVHDLVAVKDKVRYLQLDVWDINVQQVYMVQKNAAVALGRKKITQSDLLQIPLKFLTKEVSDFGDVLIIKLFDYVNKGDVYSIKVVYETPGSIALSWLTPAQTKGKKYPYMYSQCETIDCRSIVPVQDTPSNRVTYSAHVVADNNLSVYMSANSTCEPEPYDAKNTEYYFYMEITIPNYLMAIAVGNLEKRELPAGSRTSVITEPEGMNDVAKELVDMGNMLNKTEEYLTPYIWGTYTILVLPPSFPFGGMENPLLTFASPTIIVGDQSQVYVATHEMVHSWTGNTITCQNWEDFWLNEGFTVFSERHVSGEIYNEDFALVEAFLGNTSLYNDMQTFGKIDPTWASIHPVLKGRNPDNSFSEIPYEKGFQLLYFMQNIIGMKPMRTFLHYYINTNFLTSITTVQLRKTWETWVQDNYDADQVNVILAQINWSEWMYVGELAPETLDFSTAEATESIELAEAFIQLNGESSPDNYEDYNKAYSNLKVVFHDTLQAHPDEMNIAIMTEIDKDYDCTHDADPEVKQRWYPTGIMLNYTAVFEPAHQFISDMGRLKYLDPIYRAMQASGHHDEAVTWFEENKDFYHPMAVAQIQSILGITPTGVRSKNELLMLEKMKYKGLVRSRY